MRALPLLTLLVVPATTLAGDNPHGQRGACASCHQTTSPGTAPEEILWTAGGPDSTCKTCHEEDPHQTGLVPDKTTPDPVMLMYSGLLACFSCHDEPACDGRRIEKLDPYFFRGGPYETEGELCARCHAVSGEARFNPHEAMADGQRSEVCEHCHLEAPDPEDESADLKIAGPNICLGCHRETVHLGSAEHLGPVSPKMARQADAAGLPLHDGDQVVCVTCHDPHPSILKSRTRDRSSRAGLPVVSDDWRALVLDEALTERQDALGAPFDPVLTESDYVRMPIAQGELCRVCHDAAGIEALRRSKR